jgi:hypothetical protein
MIMAILFLFFLAFKNIKIMIYLFFKSFNNYFRLLYVYKNILSFFKLIEFYKKNTKINKKCICKNSTHLIFHFTLLVITSMSQNTAHVTQTMGRL